MEALYIHGIGAGSESSHSPGWAGAIKGKAGSNLQPCTALDRTEPDGPWAVQLSVLSTGLWICSCAAQSQRLLAHLAQVCPAVALAGVWDWAVPPGCSSPSAHTDRWERWQSHILLAGSTPCPVTDCEPQPHPPRAAREGPEDLLVPSRPPPPPVIQQLHPSHLIPLHPAAPCASQLIPPDPLLSSPPCPTQTSLRLCSFLPG